MQSKQFKVFTVNGCGPAFLPVWFKKLLFNWFFEASCNKHDEGYAEGGSELRRWECDFKFFRAMVRDASKLAPPLIPLALVEAVVFYLLVIMFGWTRFNYI
jgi:hypothetical protein